VLQKSTTLKVKGLDIYILSIIGSPDQEQFAVKSGVLTGNDTSWCSAISGSPLPKRTDFGVDPAFCSYTDQSK